MAKLCYNQHYSQNMGARYCTRARQLRSQVALFRKRYRPQLDAVQSTHNSTPFPLKG